ncbi:DUF4034 domain-containing protein [Amycolatopsis sp. NPDC059090]|uniref:DUF4034 domain-containing protein n=1 Tax=unclassified Amycolatopsis TaxID=2618356 RepID=UPI00366B07A6
MLGLIKLYTVPKYRRMMKAVAKDAKQRGMGTFDFMETLSQEDMARYLTPPLKQTDVARFGLPADDDITEERLLPEPLRVARDAYRAGEWQPGADLLAGIGTDWDRRSTAVSVLSKAAADDDTALKAWRAARPDDADAAIVHADSLTEVAWQIRSSHRASNVSAEQFAGFRRVLEQADEACQLAADLAPEDPTPWEKRCSIAMGRQYSRDDFREVWAGVMERDPLHVAAHGRAMQYWCAKWFGSHELMWEFAEEGAAKHPKLAWLPLAAAFEMWAADVKNPWQDKRVEQALDTLLPWLDGDGRDAPEARDSRAFAARALVELNRGEEAIEQFRHLGAHADGFVWSYHAFGSVHEFRKIRSRACRLAK